MTAASIFDHAFYVRTTKDYATDPHDVEGHWLDAVGLVEGHLRRYLAQDTYTHRLRVWPRGLVYPHAVPISTVPVSATYIVEDDYTLSGVSPDGQPLILLGISYSLTGDFGRWLTYQHDATWATVTYTGGYTSATLPAGLRRTLCQITKALVDGPSGQPGRSVKAARVGDTLVQYDVNTPSAQELDELIPGVSLALRRYRLPSYA